MNHKVCVSQSVPEQIKVIQASQTELLQPFFQPPVAGRGGDAMASPGEPSGWHLHPPGKQDRSGGVY